MNEETSRSFWIRSLTVTCLFVALELTTEYWMASWSHPDLQIPVALLLPSLLGAGVVLAAIILVRRIEGALLNHPVSPLLLLGGMSTIVWFFLIGPRNYLPTLLIFLAPLALLAVTTGNRVSSSAVEFRWLGLLVMSLGAPGLLKAFHLGVFWSSGLPWRGIAAGVALYVVLRSGEILYSKLLPPWNRHRWKIAGVALGTLTLAVTLQVAPGEKDRFESYFTGSLKPLSKKETVRRPNIILISIDALRWDAVPPRAHHLHLPNLKDLWKDSLRFEETFTTSTWTLPSHVSLFSGLLPSRHGAVFGWTRAHPSTPFYTQYLKQIGYMTGAFTDGVLVRKELGFSRGFDRYWEHPIHYRGYVPGSIALADLLFPRLAPEFQPLVGIRSYGKAANRGPLRYLDTNIRHARTWLRSIEDQPFFLFLHTYQVHDWKRRYPYSMRKIRQNHPGLVEAPLWSPNQTEYSKARVLYDYGIEILDNSIGRLVGLLKEQNLYRDSIIVITSDHGERLIQTWYPHGQGQLQESLLRVPLWVKLPDNRWGGKSYRGLFQLTDVFPAIFEYMGINPPVIPQEYPRGILTQSTLNPSFPGRKLVKGSVEVERRTGRGSLRFFVRSTDYKYTRNPTAERERFYRVQSNSLDEVLIDSSRIPSDTRTRLQLKMKWLLEEHAKHFNPYPLREIQPEVRQELRGMGYLQ